MEILRAHEVALCTLLRSYLNPTIESDPPPHSPLHPLFGKALLQEIRRADAVPVGALP